MARSTRFGVPMTFAGFLLSGIEFGTWFSRVPAVRDHLHADLRTVGLVLFCMGLGVLIAMPFGGRLIRRWGARRLCLVAALAGTAGFAILPHVHSIWAFAALLMITGGLNGTWEVCLNIHGADVERHLGRSIMPALHGFWSGGLIIGSALGAVLAGAGVSLADHLLVVMIILAVINTVVVLGWVDHRPAPAVDVAAGPLSPGLNRALTMPVLLLGVMLLFSNVGEGSASDWLALYAHDERGLGVGPAAAVFTTYTVTSTIARLAGGPVIDRFGRVMVLRACGILTAAGIATTLFLPWPTGLWPTLGAALWGLGVAVVFPIAVTAAGDHGGNNSAGAIAAVATFGYTALLSGPPLIGLLAQETSIRDALMLVGVLTLGITVLATAARPHARTPEPASSGRSDDLHHE